MGEGRREGEIRNLYEMSETNSPLWKPVSDPYWSKCHTWPEEALDFEDWWMDSFDGALKDFGSGIYLHIAAIGEDTRHRVYPRGMRGRVVRRLGSTSHGLFWIYDKVENVIVPSRAEREIEPE